MSPAEHPSWPQWSRFDDKGLARFVTPQAQRWVPLPINRLDTATKPGGYRAIAAAIYDALTAANIRYAHEAYHPSEALQTIRTPPEIVVSPREGTCLDLAALFCSLCEGNELLPILIVVEGHALAAVSTTHGVRDWNGHRPGRELFANAPLTAADPLLGMIEAGTFIAIECTGFAHSEKLGTKTFDEAVQAGRELLHRGDRAFDFAIDVAVAHYGWRIEPYPLEAWPGAWMTSIFRLLTDAPVPLAGHLKVLDFERLVDERTRVFVGRDFVVTAIDALLEDVQWPSGYILIRGEPGIGKTALSAHLVKTRGYVHHFNIAPQNIRSTREFLENVCAQLIVRYQLDQVTLPTEAGQNSAFLSRLLDQIRAKLPDEPVVIVVDALDEAEDVGVAADANRLLLPRALPDGVFFVLTSREQMDYRLDVDRRRDLYLRDSDPQNLRDVRTFVRDFLHAHVEMTERITAWNVGAEAFVELMTTKSEGNFMYLVRVLDDVCTGTLSPETIDRIQDLPTGLRQYYERHWRTMRARDEERFEKLYEPVLRLLATVRQPVSVADLQEWTGLSSARILEVIREWRGFLNESRSADGERIYRVYHTSFQDFLAEEGIGLRPSHLRIAETAIAKIPGFLADN